MFDLSCLENNTWNVASVMTATGKVIYTAETHTTGGRDHGASRSSDGHLGYCCLRRPARRASASIPSGSSLAAWSACFRKCDCACGAPSKVVLP